MFWTWNLGARLKGLGWLVLFRSFLFLKPVNRALFWEEVETWQSNILFLSSSSSSRSTRNSGAKLHHSYREQALGFPQRASDDSLSVESEESFSLANCHPGVHMSVGGIIEKRDLIFLYFWALMMLLLMLAKCKFHYVYRDVLESRSRSQSLFIHSFMRSLLTNRCLDAWTWVAHWDIISFWNWMHG